LVPGGTFTGEKIAKLTVYCFEHDLHASKPTQEAKTIGKETYLGVSDWSNLRGSTAQSTTDDRYSLTDLYNVLEDGNRRQPLWSASPGGQFEAGQLPSSQFRL
jgi:hypothetical protein